MSEILNPRFDLQQYYDEDEFLGEQIKEVRSWLETRSQFQVKIPTDLTDGQIIPFFLASNKSLHATQKRMEHYYEIRQNNPILFNKRGYLSPDELIQLSSFKYIVLPLDTPNGDRVFIHGLRESTTVKYKTKVAIKILLMHLEVDLYLHGPPKRGLIIILDMRRISLCQFRFIFKNTTRILVNYLYEGLPMKITAFHVLRKQSGFDKTLKIIQQATNRSLIEDLLSIFIVTQILTKVFDCLQNAPHVEAFHINSVGESLKEFYDIVAPPEYLPLDYGGQQESLFVLQKMCNKKYLICVSILMLKKDSDVILI